MGRSRYRFIKENQPHFVTVTVVHWLPLFGSPKVAAIVFDSLEFLQKKNRIQIFAYVFMENHLHMIFSSPQPAKNSAFSSPLRRVTSSIFSRKKTQPIF